MCQLFHPVPNRPPTGCLQLTMTDHIQLQDLATPVSQPRSRLSRSRSTSPRELEGGDVATAATETVAGAATAASAQIDQESSSLTPWRLSFFIRWVTGITSLVTHVPTALFLTAAYLTAWPSFVAQRDTQWDFTLAKWTAKKEFLEWCRLQVGDN